MEWAHVSGYVDRTRLVADAARVIKRRMNNVCGLGELLRAKRFDLILAITSTHAPPSIPTNLPFKRLQPRERRITFIPSDPTRTSSRHPNILSQLRLKKYALRNVCVQGTVVLPLELTF